jgi:hypothetical protein
MFRLDGIGGPQKSAGLGLFKPEPVMVAQKSDGTKQTMSLREAQRQLSGRLISFTEFAKYLLDYCAGKLSW